MMKRRPKPQRRKREPVLRAVHRDRLRAPRKFRVQPDPRRPFIVELILAPDRLRMREAIDFHEGSQFAATVERECMGLVRSWWGPRTRRAGVSRRGLVVARIFLNVRDLQSKPGEIVSHECGHAAMAWARHQRANLHVMPGEEVMCHALGGLVAQVNRICYAHGAFRK